MELFLKEYLTHLKLEKNLSTNTVFSYKNDINSFISFLKNYSVDDPSSVSSDHISNFFKTLKEVGLSGSSSARYFSSLKGFFLYLLKNKYILKNPIERISAPKISKKLPEVLEIAEVEKIISAPNVENKFGLRDKAILELFYACGTRVSELINLKVNDLFFNDEIIRVFGKGSKERLIPIGSSAINWITEYLKKKQTIVDEKIKK